MNAVLGSFLVMPIAWADEQHFGLMYRLQTWPPLAVAIGIFVIDFGLYLQHVTMHSIPALWRIHRVHHADAALDASSGLRVHPFELILLLIGPAIVMTLLGIPLASLIIYNTVALPWFLLNHSNMKFPAWFERCGSLLMSTAALPERLLYRSPADRHANSGKRRQAALLAHDRPKISEPNQLA